MRRLLLTIAMALSFTASLAVAADFSSVEEQMSAREFKDTGLDKLSPEELAALNAWIKNKRPAAGQVYDRAADDKVRVGFVDSSAREIITSNIIGEFTGWRGGTTFKLENGQVWEQAEGGELAGIKPMSNPKVTIRPALIGSAWKLQVEGYNSTVRVKRVK
jgi:hypothetical protein